MLLDAKNKEHALYAVYDSGGQRLPYVVSYDTETKEIEMLVKIREPEMLEEGESRHHLLLGEHQRPMVLKFILPDSYATDKDGTKIVTESVQ